MKRTCRWILTGLVLALPNFGSADDVDLPPYTAVPPCLDTAGNPVVGTVAALTGEVSIASPHCAPVPAECGSVLHAGEFVTTRPGAQVALLSDGRYVQVGGDSRLAVDTAADGSTRVAVEQGTARVIDVGSQPGPALVVATPALETRDSGADVVASVTAPGVSSICSYADPIEVREGDRVTAVSPGSCASVATSTQADVAAIPAGGVGALPLSIAAVGRCDVAAGDPVPTDVASGPPGSPLPPTRPPLPPVTYCQGGACLPQPPQPPTPPPVVCCPGGIGEQPVIFEPPPD